MKYYLDALRKLNRESKMQDMMKDRLKERLFNKVMNHGKDNLRNYFDLLRKFN